VREKGEKKRKRKRRRRRRRRQPPIIMFEVRVHFARDLVLSPAGPPPLPFFPPSLSFCLRKYNIT